MKNLFVYLIVLVFSFSIPLTSNSTNFSKTFYTSTFECLDWVEYIQVDEHWFMIIHQSDGIDVVIPVAAPIKD